MALAKLGQILRIFTIPSVVHHRYYYDRQILELCQLKFNFPQSARALLEHFKTKSNTVSVLLTL